MNYKFLKYIYIYGFFTFCFFFASAENFMLKLLINLEPNKTPKSTLYA